MSVPFQPRLFDDDNRTPHPPEDLSRANLGTFQDSLSAPVHAWFVYPAGFSYRAVEQAFELYHIKPGMAVYDPFTGTGTTNVVASQRGVESFGIEAHPFVASIAQTKVYWDFDLPQLRLQIEALVEIIREAIRHPHSEEARLEDLYPELVIKCYSREKLLRLHLCRKAIQGLEPGPFHRLARVALTHLLRSTADVATGWPYIAPQKAKKAAAPYADIPDLLRNQLYRMWSDIRWMRAEQPVPGRAAIILGDARCRQDAIGDQTIDLSFTSPPYLNNYDYADRTRLEMYFWGEARTWGDITETVRSRLMMSATTQINRGNYDAGSLLNTDVVECAPGAAAGLHSAIQQLSALRLQKGGKKSYDILTAGYFNDMLHVIRETYRVLKPGGVCVLILGDSAPYGVYIPTHTYLGEIALGTGFSRYKVEQLRERGNKWKDNPQRHKVPLQECILTLYK